ncbi:MAG: MlaD family protein [Ferrimonas sp.]
MNNTPLTPKLHRKRTLSPVWILPVLAALLGIWLLVTHIQERGSDITVRFSNATGIQANKTLVRYQGIIVGQVTKVTLAKDNISVDVQIRMQQSVNDLLRKNTQFWLVSPKASLTGINGLDALFSGNYIGMAPGDGSIEHEFVASDKAPVWTDLDKGLVISIQAKERGSLDIGSGLYYQQVKVGEIIDFKLQQESGEVDFTAIIEPEYQNLIRVDSRFWNVSGAQIVANRDGIDINVESLASLIAGGITFSTPKDSPVAVAHQQFTLFANQQDAVERIAIQLTTNDAEGLNSGSAIRYRGLQIGQISQISLDGEQVQLNAWIDQEYQDLIRSGSHFSRVQASIGLTGVKNIDTLIFGDFIRLWPGSGKIESQFTLHNTDPESAVSGRRFTLTQAKLHGVTVGAPLLYRGVNVGEVLAINLAHNGVDIEVFIAEEYQHLVRQNSRFWLEGAFEITANFAELGISAAPLANVVQGGIAFTSSTRVEEAPAGMRFPLSNSRSQALDPEPIKLQLITDSLNGLNPGSPVFYRDLEIGVVDNIQLDNERLKVTVHVAHRYHYLLNPNTRFWHYSGLEVEGSLAGLKVRANPLISMVRGGLALGHRQDQQATGEISDRTIYANEADALATGIAIQLSLKANAKIEVNSPIRYLGHHIGSVRAVSLDPNLMTQTIMANIDQTWSAQFVQADAQYYLVQPQVALSGIRNVETILSGNYITAQPGKNGQSQHHFIISTEEPLQVPYDDGLRLVLTQARLGSLHIGSPVLYRQVRVGEVIHTRLTENGDAVDIEIQLQERYQHLVNSSSRFWNASGVDIDFGVFSGADIKTESLETILAGGIAFATQEPTTANNQLESGTRLPLFDKLRSNWLSWAPDFN